MTNKKIFYSFCLAFIMFATIVFANNIFLPKLNAQTQSDLYWSESNKPVFYGVTKITMSKNAVTSFDILDPRFRTFARDFEDGDIRVQCLEQNVECTTPGDYQIFYTVTDSHNNTSTLVVPVKVLDNTDSTIDVVGRVHTIPNDWNLKQMELYRNSNGDRNMLGIYMPANSTFDFKVLSPGQKLKLSLFNNHRDHEIYTWDVNYNQDETFENIKLERNGISYSCVPFVTSPKLSRGVDISTTYDYEIKYNTTQVKKLDYFYYGDNEQQFIDNFKNGENDFGVVEGETMVILMPKGDVEAYKRFNHFTSITDHLDYYQKVVERMDEMIGLSFQPQKATDQNFRAKQFVKGDGGTGAGAYYNGGDGFVGISGAQVGSFYQMNWGGLHEIAHGYQGSLGNGSLGLGEVSNNILGHYIQVGGLYTSQFSIALGELANVEDSKNAWRFEGKTFLSTDNGFESIRLYALINLFDSFEGSTTYAKFCSYYREKINDQTFTKSTPQQDCYTYFFADCYGVNILPYWKQWGVTATIQESMMQQDLDDTTILADAINQSLQDIKDGENITRKYSIVKESVIKKYNITSNAHITFEIDDNTQLNGKFVLFEKHGKIVAQEKITNGEVDFSNIPTGTYVLRMPVLKNYLMDYTFVTLKEGENDLSFTYNNIPDTSYHQTKLMITGPNRTNGYTLLLSNQNKTGTIILGGANLGNMGDDWASRTQEVFVSVVVKNSQGEVLDSRSVNGGQFFTTVNVPNKEIELDYGSTVKVETHAPQYVQIWSLLTNTQISQYSQNQNTIEYEITEKGFMPKNNPDFNIDNTLYGNLKSSAQTQLDTLKSYFDENPDQLEAKYFSQEKKNQFIENYDKLQPQDRQTYDELYNKIVKGGKPQLTLSKQTFEYGEELNFYDIVNAFDYEDGNMKLNQNNMQFTSDQDLTQPGTYQIQVTVTDSDNNTTTQQFSITISPKPTSSLIIIICVVALVVIAAAVTTTIIVLKKRKKA